MPLLRVRPCLRRGACSTSLAESPSRTVRKFSSHFRRRQTASASARYRFKWPQRAAHRRGGGGGGVLLLGEANERVVGRPAGRRPPRCRRDTVGLQGGCGGRRGVELVVETGESRRHVGVLCVPGVGQLLVAGSIGMALGYYFEGPAGVLGVKAALNPTAGMVDIMGQILIATYKGCRAGLLNTRF